MNLKTIISLVMLLNTVCLVVEAQQQLFYPMIEGTRMMVADSGEYMMDTYPGICKGYYAEFNNRYGSASEPLVNIQKQKHQQFIVAHGSLLYEYNYNTVNTVHSEEYKFQQHREQVQLELLIQNKYPLKLSFSSTQNNARWSPDLLSLNIQFNLQAWQKNYVNKLIQYMNTALPETDALTQVRRKLAEAENDLSATRNWLSDPATLQKLIEEREIKFRTQNSETNSNYSDSIHSFDSLLSLQIPNSNEVNIFNLYKKNKHHSDSLAFVVNDLKKVADSLQAVHLHNTFTIKEQLAGAKNFSQLSTIARANGIDIKEILTVPKAFRSFNKLSFGKSYINYTPLTASDITINGIDVEAASQWYLAVAAGRITEQFRYHLFDAQRPKQYLLAGRIGYGDVKRAAVILTIYTGSKEDYSIHYSDSFHHSRNITGYSVETIFKPDHHILFSAEVAKSTTARLKETGTEKQLGALFNYSDNNNMGLYIKGEADLTQSRTRINGYYKSAGSNFQSFNWVNSSNRQTSWQIKAEQLIFGNKLSVTGMLKQNTFSDPFLVQAYRSSATFKTLVINARFRKCPVISFGYYPGNQLYQIDKEIIEEHIYYILNASISHSYRSKNNWLNSSFMLNRYISHATDSGIAAYDAINYILSQSVAFEKLQLSGGFSKSIQPELHYYTVDASFQYNKSRAFKVGGCLRYSKTEQGDLYIGGGFNFSTSINYLGKLDITFNKSYIPNFKKALYPAETGRIMWSKSF